MPFLQARGLTMRFGGVYAVKDVDFEMSEASVHCLIGPNGAGKSTFFKMLTGQLKPTSGSISLRETDITGLRPHEVARRGIGIKSQVPQLFDEMTAYENIWLSARRRKAERDPHLTTMEVVEKLQLGDVRLTPVGQLSHGLRQWVEIGAVLAAKPDLVLLDEPAAGMSDQEVDRTASLIKEISAHHSVLVVEHDMRFIRLIADRVTVLHNGQHFLEGKADDVLADERVKEIYLGKGGLVRA